MSSPTMNRMFGFLAPAAKVSPDKTPSQVSTADNTEANRIKRMPVREHESRRELQAISLALAFVLQHEDFSFARRQPLLVSITADGFVSRHLSKRDNIDADDRRVVRRPKSVEHVPPVNLEAAVNVPWLNFRT